jgi:hypothetical protein
MKKFPSKKFKNKEKLEMAGKLVSLKNLGERKKSTKKFHDKQQWVNSFAHSLVNGALDCEKCSLGS